ncbi:MAG: lipoprotein-releasing ABC transporter permease subunit [Gammaproteobacteria bacterium]
MFRPYELFIGLRYTRAKRRNQFVSFISLTSMLGVALGVAALITVLSVMNGFQQELRSRILGMTAHATISEPGPGIRDWHEAMTLASRNQHVIGEAPYVQGEGMLTSGAQVTGALIQGILPGQEGAVSDVGAHMKAGKLSDLEPGKYGIVLGDELAAALGVMPGDKVTVITPQADLTPAGVMPRLRRFTVVGIFSVGMYEYDRGIALINMQDAQRLFHLGSRVTGVRIRLDNMFLAPQVSRELAGEMPGYYRVTDWTQQHANYFKAVETEKRVMFVILTLIVAVAAFNIVSTLVMVVTDKQADIAILRTLGATPRSIMAVFVVQGAVIGTLGTLLGVIGGVTLALNIETVVPWIERVFHVQFLSPQVYYISQLPSHLEWHDVYVIGTTAFVLSLLATLYPAWRASRTQPAEALRYE